MKKLKMIIPFHSLTLFFITFHQQALADCFPLYQKRDDKLQSQYVKRERKKYIISGFTGTVASAAAISEGANNDSIGLGIVGGLVNALVFGGGTYLVAEALDRTNEIHDSLAILSESRLAIELDKSTSIWRITNEINDSRKKPISYLQVKSAIFQLDQNETFCPKSWILGTKRYFSPKHLSRIVKAFVRNEYKDI